MTDEPIDTTTEQPEAPEAPAIPEGPIVTRESRFLFVDVAAMRAKQLRRGALPRLEAPVEGEARRVDLPKKPERVAMEEVQRGVVRPLLPDIPSHVR